MLYVSHTQDSNILKELKWDSRNFLMEKHSSEIRIQTSIWQQLSDFLIIQW